MRDEEAHVFVAKLDGGRTIHPGHTLKLTSLRNTLPDWASLRRAKQDTSKYPSPPGSHSPAVFPSLQPLGANRKSLWTISPPEQSAA